MRLTVEATGVQYGSVAFVNPGTQTKLESLQNRLDQLNKKLSQIDAKESSLLNNDDIDIEHLDKELKKSQNFRKTLTNIIKEAEDEIKEFKEKNVIKKNKNTTSTKIEANTFKVTNHEQKEDLELKEVKNEKKLSNILFIKSDDNGKFYEFERLNGEKHKFYFEVNENNVPKLLKIEDFA